MFVDSVQEDNKGRLTIHLERDDDPVLVFSDSMHEP